MAPQETVPSPGPSIPTAECCCSGSFYGPVRISDYVVSNSRMIGGNELERIG
jgi:hypothetical protein